MSSSTFHEEYIATWDDLLKQQKKLTAGKWLFRGMQCAEWKLETSLERTCTLHHNGDLSKGPQVENILTREFRRRYHNHGVGISDPVGIEWLSLMQHYGAPTRLLDFTYSFFIAAYFAMEKPCAKSCSCARWSNTWIGGMLKCNPQNSHAIWAVRNKWVAQEGIELLKQRNTIDVRYFENEQNEQQWESQKSFFESLLNLQARTPEDRIERSKNNPPCVFPVNAMRLNERSTIQQGVFVCPGNVTKSFDDNLRSLEGFHEQQNLLKIVISQEVRSEALKRLHSMNINRASLFPGLQGFAESLGIYHPFAFNSE